MSLTPHKLDTKRSEIKKRIAELESAKTPEAADKLKEEFNMGEKSLILDPTAAAIAQINANASAAAGAGAAQKK